MNDDRDTYRGAFPALAVERVSEPMRIGKHEWRLLTFWMPAIEYTGTGPDYEEIERRFTGYEWRRAGFPFDADWRKHEEWPRYNPDNGTTAGLPASLRKLWERCPWAHGAMTRRPGEAAKAA